MIPSEIPNKLDISYVCVRTLYCFAISLGVEGFYRCVTSIMILGPPSSFRLIIYTKKFGPNFPPFFEKNNGWMSYFIVSDLG